MTEAIALDSQGDDTPDPVVEKASRMGWKPQEQYKGPEDRWVDAETFVKRGEEITPFLKRNNEALENRLGKVTSELEEARKAMHEFKEFKKDSETRAVERALADLKEQRKDAITNGDGERFSEVDEQIKHIEKLRSEPAPVEEKVAPPALSPEYVAWQSRNQWFKGESPDKVTRYAMEVAKELNASTGKVGTELFDLVREDVAERFPEITGGSRRSAPSPVDSGGTRGAPGGGSKGYNALPADAKAACDKFVAQGLITREEYLKEFDWKSLNAR